MLPFSFYIGHSSKCVGRNGCAARALAARSFRESRFRYISFYQWNRQCRRDIFQRLTQLRPRCCHGSSERDKRRLGCKPNTSENGGKDLMITISLFYSICCPHKNIIPRYTLSDKYIQRRDILHRLYWAVFFFFSPLKTSFLRITDLLRFNKIKSLMLDLNDLSMTFPNWKKKKISRSTRPV